MFIEKIANYNKEYFVNKRQLFVCGNCYWCLTYLPELEGESGEDFNNCPRCKEHFKRMYISGQAAAESPHYSDLSKMTQFN